jgi:hypothetical protein
VSIIQHNGHSVPVQVYDQAGPLARTDTSDFGTVVLHAALRALQYPLSTIVQAVTITIARTAMQVRLELQGARVDLRCSLLEVTARRFNDYVRRAENDPEWDPDIKRLYLNSLRTSLESELRRLTVTST